jgi:hypothetical protein
MREERVGRSLALSRRVFLQRAAFTASLLTMARLPAAAHSALAAAAAPAGSGLSGGDRELLTQVVERMVDSGDPAAPPVRATGTIATIERLLSHVDASVRGDLPLALRLFDWGPVLFDFRWHRFTGLDDGGKDQAVRSWMESRFAFRRLVFDALRNLAFVGYYSQDATWPLVGYKGPLLGEGAAP